MPFLVRGCINSCQKQIPKNVYCREDQDSNIDYVNRNAKTFFDDLVYFKLDDVVDNHNQENKQIKGCESDIKLFLRRLE